MAINVAKIQAELDLDTGRFHGAVTSAAGAVGKFNTSLKSANSSIHNIERRVTGLGASLRDTMVVLGQFRAAVHTVWSFTGQWVFAIVDANAKLERLQMLMKGLSKASTEAGRVTDALEGMNYVLDKAKNAPFTIDTIADTFVKLKASGIDPTKGSIDALTEATARFGGSSETLHRAAIAIQQMAGKGVISMEELRQQLGEAVPNAMQLMAQATGMSMAKLVKLISSGRLQASGALDKLFLEMRIQFAGSSERMMETWTGMIQKLKTEWLTFAQEIGGGGMFDEAKAALRDLIAFMGSQDGKAFAREIGQTLADATKAAVSLVKWLVENRDELVKWGKLLAEIFVVKRIVDFGTMLIRTTYTLGGLTKTLRDLGKMMALARAGTLAWTAVLNAALGPIGIAVTAIGGLIFWLKNQADAAKKAGDAMQDYYDRTDRGETVSAKEHNDMQDRLDFLKKVKDFVESSNRMGNGLGMRASQEEQIAMDKKANELMGQARAYGWLPDGKTGMNDFVTSLNEKAKILAKVQSDNLINMNMEVTRQGVLQAQARAKAITSEFAKGQERAGEEIMKATVPTLNAIQAEMDKGSMTQEQGAEKRNKTLMDAINKRVDRLKAARVNLEQQLSTTVNPAAIEAAKNNMAEVDKLLQQAYDDRDTVQAPLKLMPKMGLGGNSEAQKDNLTKYFERIKGQVASLRAAVDDGNPDMAKFDALLETTFFDSNRDPVVIAKVRKELEELKKLKDQKIIEGIKDDLHKLDEQSASDVTVAQLESTNEMYAKIATNMVSYNRKLAALRFDWLKAHGTLKDFNAELGETKENMSALDLISLGNFTRDSEWSAYLDSLPTHARALAEFNHEMEMNAQTIAKFRESDPKHAAEIDALGARSAAAITQKYENATRPAWKTLIAEWQDTNTQFNQVWANSMQNFSNTLTEAVTGGKASFKDLASSILKEITRILVSKAVAQLAQFVLTVFTPGATAGAGGGAAQTRIGTGPAALGAAFMTNGFQVERYAKGGTFTNSITKQRTVAPMVEFGEKGPEAIMPLARDGSGKLGVEMMGGGGGMVNQISISVQVNQDGSSNTDVKSQSEAGRQLGGLIDSRVRDTMVQEMRPGGLLWRMQN